MNEREIQQRILLALGSRPDVRLFRNNVGIGWQGRMVSHKDGRVILDSARPLHAGLHVGSGDLIGFQRIVITPEMVGQALGAFVSLEVKTATGRPEPEQANWLAVCQQFGALAAVVRSVDEATAAIH